MPPCGHLLVPENRVRDAPSGEALIPGWAQRPPPSPGSAALCSVRPGRLWGEKGQVPRGASAGPGDHTSGHMDRREPGARVHTDSVLVSEGASLLCVFSKEPQRVTQGLEPTVHTSGLPTELLGRGWARPHTQMATEDQVAIESEFQMNKNHFF